MDYKRAIEVLEKASVFPAGKPVARGINGQYSYPLESIALVHASHGNEEVERVFAWDPQRKVWRSSVLTGASAEANKTLQKGSMDFPAETFLGFGTRTRCDSRVRRR